MKFGIRNIDRFAERVRTKRIRLTVFLSLLLAPYSLLQAITTEQDQQFTYYWYAAKQAIDQERYADALSLLEFCHAINPADGQTLTFLGVLYNAIGQKEAATEMFRQAFEADPRDQWYKYSYALLEQRTPESFRQAIQVMEKALKANPESEELMDQLLRLYTSDEQWSKAIQIQDRLDKLRGYDSYSALNRYRIYILWGKPKKAIAAVDKYLELDPTNLQFLLFRLEVMERTKAKKEVLYPMYEKILAMDPTNPMVLNNYAYHLATNKGDLKKAERMSALTIREYPDNPVYLDTYGWILHQMNLDELALFYLNKALTNAKDGTKSEIENHIKQIKK